MAIRDILTGDEPRLYKVSRPVETIDERILTLLDDMKDTLYEAQGVGLAAPQVGVLRRVVVIDVGDGLMELINPEILSAEGEQGGMEGCLSFPGQSGYVVRANRVKVRAMDRTGAWKEYVGEGLLARAFLHETDHLDGKVYLDLVTEPPEGYADEDDEE